MNIVRNAVTFCKFSSLALFGSLLLSASPHTFAQPSGLSGDSGAGPIRKKLINRGWASPTSGEFGSNLKQIEASPFDGVAIKFMVKDDEGKEVACFMGGYNKPWKPEWFKEEIAALKKIKSEKLKESYFSISIAVAPHLFTDPFDDEGWKTIIEHFRIAAWVAKEAGLKGVMIDLESYGASVLKYKSRKTEKSFDEYAAQVRKRGREMMEAMAKEYPDMTLFTLFLNSGPAMAVFGGDPRPNLEPSNGGYTLMPAFLNGWLDVVPPKMTIVDGMEHSYPHSTEIAYLRRINAAKNDAIAFVAEENRAKFRAQVQTGLAIYLDAFLADRKDVHSDVYTDPPLEGSLADRLRDSTALALDAVDEYVWIFDEQYRFWPTNHKRVQSAYWDELIPGTTEALRTANDPQYRMLRRATAEFEISEHKAGIRGVPMKNLIKEGNFPLPRPLKKGEKAAEPVAEAWISEGSSGVLVRAKMGSSDSGSALLKGAAEGGWNQEIEVNPTLFYKLRVAARQSGAGEPVVRLIWKDANGVVIETATAKAKNSPREGWARIETTAKAPTNAKTVTVQLTATGQKSDSDQVWYDDAEFYRIGVN